MDRPLGLIEARGRWMRQRDRRADLQGADWVFGGTLLNNSLMEVGCTARRLAVAALWFLAVPSAAQAVRPSGLIAFERPLSPEVTEIFTMRPNGSHVRQLTHSSGGGSSTDPVWSPDGSRLAMIVTRIGAGSVETEIDVIRADGSQRRRIISVRQGVPAIFGPMAWSPDGSRIAFARTPDMGHPEIYEVWIRGSRVKQLTSTRGDNQGSWAPSWSPDGLRIAFSRSVGTPGSQFEIYVMRANGANPRRLTMFDSENFEPAWSPDGSRIAFVSDRDPGGGKEIYLMRPDGSHVTRLTHNSSEFQDSPPVWSPDGSRIVYGRDTTNVYRTFAPRLRVINADGKTDHAIGPADSSSPSWAP